MNKNTVSWNIIEAFLVLICVNIFIIIFNIADTSWYKALSHLVSPENYKIGELFVASLIQFLLFVIFVFYIVLIKHKKHISALGIHNKNLKHWIWSGIKSGFLIFMMVVILGVIIERIFPDDLEPQKVAEIIMNAKGWKQMMIPFIVTGIFAPISEEIYFRGFLYPAFAKKFGKKFGMVLTSIVFGAMHFDLIRMIPLALGGLWLNWLYERSGSLYTNITAHAIWNLIMTLLLFGVPQVV